MFMGVTILIILHSLTGSVLVINPDMITSMKASDPNRPNEHVAEGANCAINLADGKFVTVKEHCKDVLLLIEGPPK